MPFREQDLITIQDCFSESVFSHNEISYTWNNFGNYDKRFANYDEALAYARSMYDQAIKSPEGYTYVARGGTVGTGSEFYQYGQINPNTGDRDANGCNISCKPWGGCEHVCGYVRNFDEYFNARMIVSQVPVYDSIEHCNSKTCLPVRLSTFSDAQPVQDACMTEQELQNELRSIKEQIAFLEQEMISDPSDGRARSLSYANARLESIEQVLNGSPLSNLDIVQRTQQIAEVKDSVVFAPEPIYTDLSGNVRTFTQGELDRYIRDITAPTGEPFPIGLGIGAGAGIAILILLFVLMRRKK